MKWHFFEKNIQNIFCSDSFVYLLSIKLTFIAVTSFLFMDKACIFQVKNAVFQSLTGVCKKIQIWKHHISGNNEAIPMRILLLCSLFNV